MKFSTAVAIYLIIGAFLAMSDPEPNPVPPTIRVLFWPRRFLGA